MKKATTILLILLTLNGHSQTKQDSVMQAKAAHFVDSVVNKATIRELREWVYKNLTGEKGDEFMAFYQAFLQAKYNEWLNEQKKKQ